MPGSDVYRAAIAGNDIGKLASLVPTSITFTQAMKPINRRGSVAKLTDGRQVIWMEGLSPALLDGLAAAATLTMATNSGATGSVPVVGAAKAVEALRRCSADQLMGWGADAAQFAPGGMLPVVLKDRDEWLSNQQLIAMICGSRLSAIDAVFRIAVRRTAESMTAVRSTTRSRTASRGSPVLPS